MATKPRKTFTTPRATARNWTFTFGLVQVPVGLAPLYSESDRPKGTKICPDHNTPVKQGAYYCDTNAHPVPDPVTGYAYEYGYVTFTEAEKEAFHPSDDKSIALRAYVDPSSIDPTLYENSYMAWPQDDKAVQSYSLLAAVLAKNEKALVGEGVFWGSLRTFVVSWSSVHECLLVQTSHYYANLRQRELEIVRNIDLPMPDEMAMGLAEQLLGALPDTYDWENVRDVVADRQHAAIAEKVATGTVTVSDTPFTPAEIPDLLEQLKASIA